MVGSAHGPKHRGEQGSYDGHHWHRDAVLIPDAERTLPETVPLDYLAGHPLSCGCAPCNRYPDRLQLERKKRVRSGLRRRA